MKSEAIEIITRRIVEFAEIVERCGPASDEACLYYARHRGDAEFASLARSALQLRAALRGEGWATDLELRVLAMQARKRGAAVALQTSDNSRIVEVRIEFAAGVPSGWLPPQAAAERLRAFVANGGDEAE